MFDELVELNPSRTSQLLMGVEQNFFDLNCRTTSSRTSQQSPIEIEIEIERKKERKKERKSLRSSWDKKEIISQVNLSILKLISSLKLICDSFIDAQVEGGWNRTPLANKNVIRGHSKNTCSNGGEGGGYCKMTQNVTVGGGGYWNLTRVKY